MRYVSLILAMVFLGGLLIPSQALTAGRTQHRDSQMSGAPTGEQLRQFHRVQDQTRTQEQALAQERFLTRDQVREMQALLNHRGYYISSYESDGIGRETMAAIANFQRDQGLTVTGLPNDETLQALALSTSQHEIFGIAPEFGGDEE